MIDCKLDEGICGSAVMTYADQRGTMRNEKDDKPRPRSAAQPADAEEGRPDTASKPRFFLAVHHGKLGASRIYRVYPQADGLSFLGLGPPHPWIDLESARRLDETHWAVRASRVIRKGVALAIAGGSPSGTRPKSWT